jgi:hypothetical protein
MGNNNILQDESRYINEFLQNKFKAAKSLEILIALKEYCYKIIDDKNLDDIEKCREKIEKEIKICGPAFDAFHDDIAYFQKDYSRMLALIEEVDPNFGEVDLKEVKNIEKLVERFKIEKLVERFKKITHEPYDILVKKCNNVINQLNSLNEKLKINGFEKYAPNLSSKQLMAASRQNEIYRPRKMTIDNLIPYG